MRDFVLTVFFLVAGIYFIYHSTNDFNAFTAEGARRYSITENPVELSDYQLINSDGDDVRFSDYQGKTLLIDFIYTRCPTVCMLLGNSYAHTQKQLIQNKALNDVVLISISFDLAYDTPTSLKAYQKRYSQAEQQWQLLMPKTAQQLQLMLEEFGVVVIEDEYGGFVHNSAIHISDSYGQLVNVIDWQYLESVDYDVSSIVQ